MLHLWIWYILYHLINLPHVINLPHHIMYRHVLRWVYYYSGSFTFSLSTRYVIVLVTYSPHAILCLLNITAFNRLSQNTLHTCAYYSKIFLLQIRTKGVMSGKNVSDEEFVLPSPANGICHITMTTSLPLPLTGYFHFSEIILLFRSLFLDDPIQPPVHYSSLCK